MEITIILGLIITIIVLITIIKDKNKEVEKYRNDWKFCKKLIDKKDANH